MNFLCQDFRKLSSDIQTDIQTDTTKIIYHAASRVVNDVGPDAGCLYIPPSRPGRYGRRR